MVPCTVVAQRGYVTLVMAAVVVGGAPGCRNNRMDTEQRQSMGAKTIQQVQEEHTPAWMAIPGVVGTAIGQCQGRSCILVLTASNTEQIRKEIPAAIDGYPVVVQYSGPIRARDQ